MPSGAESTISASTFRASSSSSRRAAPRRSRDVRSRIAPAGHGHAGCGRGLGDRRGRRGACAGWSLAEALARCPTFELVPADPLGVERAWERTARALEGMGAQLELARPGLAYFDVEALRRCHGGVDGVIVATRRALGRRRTRIGVAPTRFCALAAALRGELSSRARAERGRGASASRLPAREPARLPGSDRGARGAPRAARDRARSEGSPRSTRAPCPTASGSPACSRAISRSGTTSRLRPRRSRGASRGVARARGSSSREALERRSTCCLHGCSRAASGAAGRSGR